jgi:hypothetical protein
LLVEKTTANGKVRIVSADDGRTTVDELTALAGRYPEWRDLVSNHSLPIERYAARVKVPARQLIEAADALGKLAADGGGYVVIEIRGESSP